MNGIDFRRKFLLANCVLALLLLALSGFSQSRNVPLSSAENRAILENIDSRAQGFVAKNLNRFGLDKLGEYDKVLDSLYATELKDTLALMERNYTTGSSKLLTDIKNQESNISTLMKEKEELTSKYSRLIKIAGLSFAVWLVFVIIFLQFQRKKVGKEASILSKVEIQLKKMNDSHSKTSAVINQLKLSKNAFAKLQEDAVQLQQLVIKIAESPSTPATVNETLRPACDGIATVGQFENRLVQSLISQDGPATDDLELSDMNKLCEEVYEIGRRGFPASEDFNVQFTKDLEKNLQPVKANAASVRNLLFSTLLNAVQSVKNKSAKGEKGYQPKVGISTRILPRFLQIRVRDNGAGMPEEVLQKATQEFFSTSDDQAGLGLAVSKKTMEEIHKGELKLESENGNSADVYIKFFVK